MSRNFPRHGVLAVPLLLVIAVCSGDRAASQASDQSQPASHQIGQKRQIKGLPNFGEVTPKLFRGAHPAPDGFETLAKMGVNIVVDARGGSDESENRRVNQLGMRYVSIPWRCPFPKDEVFIKFLKLLRDNPDKKVFVHCRLGDDRTGMMVASYRMAMQGWTADEAMREMEQFGYSPVHHYVLCPRLVFYEKDFPEHLKKNPAFEALRSSSHSAKP